MMKSVNKRSRASIEPDQPVKASKNLEPPFKYIESSAPDSVKDFVHKKTRVKFKDLGGTMKLPTGSILPFVEKFGVYFIGLNVVDPVDSNSPDTLLTSSLDVDTSPAISDKNTEMAIDVLDHAIKALAVEDLSHLNVDAVPDVPLGFNSQCGDGCRDPGCRRGLVRRPNRKSSFTRPVP